MSGSPDNFNIEPFYKDLRVLYDSARMLKHANIMDKQLNVLVNSCFHGFYVLHLITLIPYLYEYSGKKEKFLELRSKGETYERIAKDLGVSKQTLINWSKEKEIQEAIEVSRIIQYQSILKRFEASKKQKLEFYSELSQKVRKELKNLNFDNVKPEKLLEISLKCDKKLNELVEGKILGGDSIFEDFGKNPNFYFNPED